MLESWFGDKHKAVATEHRQRTPEEQAQVDAQTAKFALYFYETCFFCGRVRNHIERLALDIELRDIHTDRSNHETLARNGGSGTVPCLRVENDDQSITWMYESADIIDYLEANFG